MTSIRNIRSASVLLVLSCMAMATSAWGQQALNVPQGSVFTCTDARGLHITSDRLIPECRDREQRVLSPSGVERTRIGPMLTAHERAQLQERNRRTQQDLQREQDQRRRDRVLLLRYPDRAAHDAERRQHLSQFDDLLALAGKRLADMEKHHAQLRQDMAPYQSNPAQAPEQLRSVWQETNTALAEQQRLIASTTAARDQMVARLDEELHRLQTLWSQQQAPAPGDRAATPAAPQQPGTRP